MKTIISEKEAALKAAAKSIVELIAGKPDACLAFSVSDVPGELYDELVRCYNEGMADFSGVKVFSVGEYIPGDELGELLWDQFLSKINVKKENCFLLGESSFADYDGLIAYSGGLDMVVLGLGDNCRLAFNEPGTAFSSLTHIQKLSYGKHQKAMTLGIRSITDAKKIIVTAFGEKKADALFKMLYSRTDPAVPAAFLQIPSDVTVYADGAAAVRL